MRFDVFRVKRIVVSVLAALLFAQSIALAQKTTETFPGLYGGTATRTTEITKDPQGNKTTTVTTETKNKDGSSNVMVKVETENPQGHLTFVKYEITYKNAKGDVTSTSIDTSNYHYDSSGGYVLESYHGTSYPGEGIGYDIKWVELHDKNGNILSGENTSTETKPGAEPKTTRRKYVNGQYVEIGFTPVLDETAAKPGNGVANETAYLPDVAGPSSVIVGTVDDPDQEGPSAEVIVQYEDTKGRSKFFKTLTDAQHLVHLKALADTARITLFKAFDKDGKPDARAVHCDIAGDGVVKGSDPIAKLPPRGPAITRASSAYERGTRGLVNLQTRGLEPSTTMLTLDGSPRGIRTLAVSNLSAKGQIEGDATLGTHLFSATSAGGRTNDVPADVVSLRPDPLAPTRPGVVQTLTVHCDGLPPTHPAVMFFSVSGATQLADGGELATVPVKDGIAQVRIRGVHSGSAIVRFKLHVTIPGYWES